MNKKGTLYFDNNQVNYFCFGKGDKPLLLIQGLQANDLPYYAGFQLSYYYKIFTKQYKVYIIDRKKVIPDNYTLLEIAEDYAKAMNLLNISNCYIFGASQGGVIAQMLAINHPELVKKLVLGVTLSRPNDITKQVIQQWIEMVQNKKYNEFVKDNIIKSYSENYVKKNKFLFPILYKLMKPKNPQKFINLAKTLLDFNTYDQLNKIQCSVMIIGGAEDQIVTGNASVEIAQKIGCPIYMYKRLGHAAYDEAKDFNKKVFDFFETIN